MLVFGVLLVAWPPSVPAVRAQSASFARSSVHTVASRGAVSKRDDHRAGACVVRVVNVLRVKTEQRVINVQHKEPRVVTVQHVVYVPHYVTVTRVVYVPRYITHVVYVHDPAPTATPAYPTPTPTPAYPTPTPTPIPYVYP
jgi:hypothetical protein